MSTVVDVRCSTCGKWFDPTETAGTFDGSTAFYWCPGCTEWVKGPPPGE